jgi:hypothetical protein
MKRIIQKYQEGGVVQPGVATGLPAGGNAGPAIQRYLNGYTAGPLSTSGRNSYVPDYRKLADDRKKIREATATTTTTGTDTTVTDDGGGGGDTAVTTTVSTDGRSAAERIADNRANVDAIVAAGEGNIAGVPNILDASQSDDEYYQKFRENYEVANQHAANNPYGQTTGTPLSQQGFTSGDSLLPGGSSSGGTFSGGGSDGVGNFGKVGDFLGGIGDSLGITDYAGQAAQNAQASAEANIPLSAFGPVGPTTPYSPPTPTTGWDGNTYVNNYSGGADSKPAHATDNDGPPKPGDSDYAAYSSQMATKNILDGHGAGGGGHTGVVFDNSNDSYVVMIDGKRMGSRGGAKEANERLAELRAGLNNGGPISMNPSRVQKYNNGSTGGVAIANSRLNEEEIRQRQLMQSPLPKAQASPLSGIGEGLMTTAVNNGLNTGLATMAGKEGLVGTLGTMMGSGGAGATAVTGGLGAGMMAALGPIGIGLGLGKLFGVFNDGGKVPCSCGKTSCKCAKEIKSPLSGE